jgi:predicted patatin/cPLA2 family phospholipase
MATALEQLGATNAFDVVYGSSAGAFNGAFFLARQAAYGTTIYYENLIDHKFISFAHLLRRRPVADLDIIFQQIIVKEKVLDWASVIHSPIPLKVVTSSIDQMRSVLLDGFKDREDLFAALKASSKMPLVAGGPLEIGGDRYFDASLFEPIPLRSPLDDGCTHLLVLLSRPMGVQPRRAGFIDRSVIAPRLDKLRAGLGRAYLERWTTHRATLSMLYGDNTSSAAPFVTSVATLPTRSEVSRIERDSRRLRAGARHGAEAVMALFDLRAAQVIDVLRAFTQSGHAIGGL